MARELGPTADAVRYNLARLRAGARLSLRDLAELMPEGPGSLSHSAIGEVERGVRRLDTDELMALAATLRVSPLTFFLPETRRSTDDVGLTGFAGPIPASAALAWLQGLAPADPREAADDWAAEGFRRRSLPEWALREKGKPDGA
jgi:transcriptional regulator with XRE-family HTH domain